MHCTTFKFILYPYNIFNSGISKKNYYKMRETLTSYTEPYTKFVIRKLIEIKGKSESEVVSFIVKNRISEFIACLTRISDMMSFHMIANTVLILG